jgi:hypothetical protein
MNCLVPTDCGPEPKSFPGHLPFQRPQVSTLGTFALSRLFRPQRAFAATASNSSTSASRPQPHPETANHPSRQALYHRLRYHMQGNAEGSTLRLTLGCLLSARLGIGLRRVGSGTRLTFSIGEERVSQWMAEHARVVWHACEEPWKLEEELIRSVCLPLNLDQNAAHEVFPV